jgi:Beta-galactosidase
MKLLKILLLSSLLSFCVSGLVWSQSHVPYLKKQGAITQLIVNNKPFLMLAGELGNSTASHSENLDQVFTDLHERKLNTVLVPIAWEQFEPQEGKFDYTLIDDIIASVRKNNLKLVILWFGSWKNTYSSYIPEWVKRDTQRFPRVLMRSGRPTERLSTFSENNWKADAKAYAALMKHIKSVDTARTILMMQVQNEVGVIPEPRDFSPEANAAFNASVPEMLMNYMIQNSDKLEPELHGAWIAAGKKLRGSWQEVFGAKPFTDDLFMAWHYATYIEVITAAGKAEYDVPMFTNAALIRPNYLPGQYNSGGPLPHSMDLYNVGAPSLDFISPDIYFANFAYWAERYNREGNPLFIPETAGGATGAANAYYAFGQQNAIGFSPFGIEGRVMMPGATTNATDPLINTYAVLEHLAPEIVQKQGNKEQIAAIVLEGREQRNGRIEFGGYIITVNWSGNAETNNRIGIIFIKTGEDEFLVAGSGNASLSFAPAVEGNFTAGIASIDEELLVNENWVWQRRLNGDQNGQGQVLNIPSSMAVVYKLKLYKY